MRKPKTDVATSRKIKFDESGEEEESFSQDEEEELEQELADVTFEELQKARSDGSHTVYKKPNVEKKGGRANKNRPMEISSKKPVGRFREVIQVPKRVARDPRFESLCGKLDPDWFKRKYNFIYENELPAEKEELKKTLKKSNDPEVIDEIKNRISLILKLGSKNLLRNTRNSRHLASSSPLLKKEEGRTLQKTTNSCLTAAPNSSE
ncbi:hypothetical protein RJ640_018825 [Escallonia rubra]|uniref:rRNA biogenesis protein RRP36 n=1 Tax=Escallonia rubra TaxID=112253 RepID=A0AA88RZH6_9ASTE|nr:hypothetical protein RJ640_018825 [Escallonia rubra]